MYTDDGLVYFTAAGGMVLIVGGLLGLLRGAISLTREPGGDKGSSGLSFEFQGLKQGTDYPAIAIFCLGWLLFALAAHVTLQQTLHVTLDARIEGVSPDKVDTLAAVPLVPLIENHDGSITYTVAFNQHTDNAWLVFITPGRDPGAQIAYGKLEKSGPFWSPLVARFKAVQVGSVTREEPAPATIITPQVPLPGVSEAPGRF